MQSFHCTTINCSSHTALYHVLHCSILYSSLLPVWHSIGHKKRIFSLSGILLVTSREYSPFLAFYWSSVYHVRHCTVYDNYFCLVSDEEIHFCLAVGIWLVPSFVQYYQCFSELFTLLIRIDTVPTNLLMSYLHSWYVPIRLSIIPILSFGNGLRHSPSSLHSTSLLKWLIN
jgi:hypothetical protein